MIRRTLIDTTSLRLISRCLPALFDWSYTGDAPCFQTIDTAPLFRIGIQHRIAGFKKLLVDGLRQQIDANRRRLSHPPDRSDAIAHAHRTRRTDTDARPSNRYR